MAMGPPERAWKVPDQSTSKGSVTPTRVGSIKRPGPLRELNQAPPQSYYEPGPEQDRDGKRIRTSGDSYRSRPSGYHEPQTRAFGDSYRPLASGYHESQARPLGDSYRPQASGYHESRPQYSGSGDYVRSSGYHEPLPQRYEERISMRASGYHDPRSHPSGYGDAMNFSGYKQGGPQSYVNHTSSSHYNINRSGINQSVGMQRLVGMGCKMYSKEDFRVGQVGLSKLLNVHFFLTDTR